MTTSSARKTNNSRQLSDLFNVFKNELDRDPVDATQSKVRTINKILFGLAGLTSKASAKAEMIAPIFRIVADGLEETGDRVVAHMAMASGCLNCLTDFLPNDNPTLCEGMCNTCFDNVLNEQVREMKDLNKTP